MKIKILIIISLFSQLLLVKAQQNDPVLCTINDQEISKSEFIRIYKKNLESIQNSEQKTIKEYLELFINFKLKVMEAELLGMDTLDSFKKELNKYRQQLAKSYLTSKKTDEKLLKEAYERLNYDINASHILIALEPYASEEDTLKAYKKAMNIRQRILNGESFDVVAKGTSDDPSVKRNGGNLGYFTVFQMVYPFETAAYTLNPGDVSFPVKTRFGYHIIKVHDKRKAIGKIKVAHIMIMTPKESSEEQQKEAKNKIYEIYHKIKNGEDFSNIAKQYSQDPGSAKNGGELPWFGAGRMIPEFEKKAFSLKNNGDISEPIKTFYGWHIIKRLDRENIYTFELMKDNLKNRLARNHRLLLSQDFLVKKLKKEYNFTEDTSALKELYDIIPEQNLLYKWNYKEIKLTKSLFNLKGNNYLQKDFVNYFMLHLKNKKIGSTKTFINKEYTNYIKKTVLAFEDNLLEDKYPDFKHMVKEYRDGILLFELTDDMVWSKSINDSTELKNYYNKNKNKYVWDNEVNATIYNCANSTIAEKLNKFLKKNRKKSYNNEDIFKMLKINRDDPILEIKKGNFKDGEHAIVDKVNKKEGISNIINENNRVYIINIEKMRTNEIKPFNKAKAMVIVDYQNYLEEEWIKQLKNKYKIKINEPVLSTIK